MTDGRCKDHIAPHVTSSRAANIAQALTHGPFLNKCGYTHLAQGVTECSGCELKAQRVSYCVEKKVTHLTQSSMTLLDQILAQVLPVQPALQSHEPRAQPLPLAQTTPSHFATVEMFDRMAEQRLLQVMTQTTPGEQLSRQEKLSHSVKEALRQAQSTSLA